MNRQTKLQSLIEERFNGKQADFERAIKRSPSQIHQWLSGYRMIGDGAARHIELELKLPLGWMDGKNSQAIIHAESVMALHEEDKTPAHLVLIKESNVELSAGNGALHYGEIEESTAKAYDMHWLSREGLRPEYLKRFKVRGDSMEPTLFKGDTVLVNLQETTPRNNTVFALMVDGELRIKRLYTKVDGSLILHSDNPGWVPRQEELSPQQVEELIVIVGRVRDKSGSGGL